MKRWRVLGLSGAVIGSVAAVTLGLSAPAALADTTLTVTYPISGTSHIASTDSDLDLGPGTLTGSVDATTGAVSAGAISLPDATGTFDELGLVPVTATVAFRQVGQITGQVDVATGGLTATSQLTLQITDLKVAGVDVAVGSHCQTTEPATVDVSSDSGFNIFTGGTVSGSYTIPDFSGCGLLGIESPVINAVIPGPGNTISLTLGTPQL